MPRLEHFVRFSNLGPRRVFAPLRIEFPAHRQALVSETAFMLWSFGAQPQRSEAASLQRATIAARNRLGELGMADKVAGQLSSQEIDAVRELARRLDAYTTADHYQLADVRVEPRLAGCGVVTGGVPDILARYGDRQNRPMVVVEVKAVDRSFRSADFRQLAAYVVLYFAEHQVLIEVLALFNPLRGTSLEVGTEEFFDDAAGAPADELVQRFVGDWSAAGVSQ
jgi:hypothetical protein